MSKLKMSQPDNKPRLYYKPPELTKIGKKLGLLADKTQHKNPDLSESIKNDLTDVISEEKELDLESGASALATQIQWDLLDLVINSSDNLLLGNILEIYRGYNFYYNTLQSQPLSGEQKLKAILLFDFRENRDYYPDSVAGYLNAIRHLAHALAFAPKSTIAVIARRCLIEYSKSKNPSSNQNTIHSNHSNAELLPIINQIDITLLNTIIRKIKKYVNIDLTQKGVILGNWSSGKQPSTIYPKRPDINGNDVVIYGSFLYTKKPEYSQNEDEEEINTAQINNLKTSKIGLTFKRFGSTVSDQQIESESLQSTKTEISPRAKAYSTLTVVDSNSAKLFEQSLKGNQPKLSKVIKVLEFFLRSDSKSNPNQSTKSLYYKNYIASNIKANVAKAVSFLPDLIKSQNEFETNIRNAFDILGCIEINSSNLQSPVIIHPGTNSNGLFYDPAGFREFDRIFRINQKLDAQLLIEMSQIVNQYIEINRQQTSISSQIESLINNHRNQISSKQISDTARKSLRLAKLIADHTRADYGLTVATIRNKYPDSEAIFTLSQQYKNIKLLISDIQQNYSEIFQDAYANQKINDILNILSFESRPLHRDANLINAGYWSFADIDTPEFKKLATAISNTNYFILRFCESEVFKKLNLNELKEIFAVNNDNI